MMSREKNITQRRQRYSTEFKLDVIAQVTEQGYSIRHAAKEMGVGKKIYADMAEMRRDITDYIVGYYRKIRPHAFNKQLTHEKKEQLFYDPNLLKCV